MNCYNPSAKTAFFLMSQEKMFVNMENQHFKCQDADIIKITQRVSAKHISDVSPLSTEILEQIEQYD